MVRATAEADGRATIVGIEQEPGSAGKGQADHYRLKVLRGYIVEADKVTGDKATRAIAVASAMSNGDLDAVRAHWLPEWLEELDGFPGNHDDQVDSLSGAHTLLTKGGPMRTYVPRGNLPTTVVRDGDVGRTQHPIDDAEAVPNGNGKAAAAAGLQGMPRKLQRRAAPSIDVSPMGPNRGSL
jgi:predicted phage terminase large subunit-like protein